MVDAGERGQKFRRKGTQLLSHMVALGRELFAERLGVDDEIATEIAIDYAHELAKHFGGHLFYFPKDLALTLSRRDRQIFAEFNGANHDSLARRYNLTVPHIYRLIERCRRQQIALRQGRLFDPDEPGYFDPDEPG